MSKPDLTIVMAVGQDDYGSVAYRDVEPAVPTPERARALFCFSTLYQAFRNINYELILVDWGVDGESRLIRDSWNFLIPMIRIIEVPKNFTSSGFPERSFHETHAKNIAIRRARADTILSINPDCLWLEEFPKELLDIDTVMIANRATTYHTILECYPSIPKLKEFVSHPENIMTTDDWGSNGDFTMMPRDLWFRLQGFSTPPGDYIAGIDQQQVQRAAQITGSRLEYPYKLWHIRHPGRALHSGFHILNLLNNWGFPEKYFKEWSFC